MPEGYFEKLHSDIMARIDDLPAMNTAGQVRRSTFAVTLRYVAAAAVVIAVVMLSGTMIWGSGDAAVAENIVADSAAAVENAIGVETPVASADVVAVTQEVVAAAPMETHGVKPEPKSMKSASPRRKVSPANTTSVEYTADEVDEILMIDGQMIHQMLVSEM